MATCRHRNREWHLSLLKSKDAVLVPAAIIGNYKLFSRIEVRFGKSISFDKYRQGEKMSSSQLKEISADLFTEVAKLMES